MVTRRTLGFFFLVIFAVVFSLPALAKYSDLETITGRATIDATALVTALFSGSLTPQAIATPESGSTLISNTFPVDLDDQWTGEIIYRVQLLEYFQISPRVHLLVDPTHTPDDVIAVFGLRARAQF